MGSLSDSAENGGPNSIMRHLQNGNAPPPNRVLYY